MATALYPFDLVQLGMEATKGTIVAATRRIVGDGVYGEQQDFYRPPYARGVRANVGGAGVITRKGSIFDIQTDLSAEQILWPWLTGVVGAVTPVGAGADKTWTFTPALTTGVPTIDAASIEYAQADGVTNHYFGKAAYAMTSSFKIDWAFNQPAKLSWSMFARSRADRSSHGRAGALPHARAAGHEPAGRLPRYDLRRTRRHPAPHHRPQRQLPVRHRLRPGLHRRRERQPRVHEAHGRQHQGEAQPRP
jgi:hypothetical protein